MLEIAGTQRLPEQHQDGDSLVPLFRGESALGREKRFSGTTRTMPIKEGFRGAIRMGSWKLIKCCEDGSVHLYHLDENLGERKDLADSQPDRVKTMRSRLHEWYWETGVRFLRPVKNGSRPWHPFEKKRVEC